MVPYFLQRLELDITADERAIRRAYARELKKIDQETDPAGFQALRTAYDAALNWAQRTKASANQTETAAPQANASPSYAPPKVVPRFRVEDVVPAAAPEHNEAMDDASEAFARFMEEFQAAVSNTASTLDAKAWQENLAQCLASDRLVNVTTRDTFEFKFARLLSDGWKPGHEVLFVVAAKVFGWDEDRRHLRGLGALGHVLERALQERALFDSQPPNQRMAQRAVIQRLRNTAEPTHEELKSHRGTPEKLAANFPTWLGMITDTRQLQRWCQLESALPPKTGKAPEVNDAQLLRATSRTASKPSSALWVVLLVLFALINGLRACDNKPAQPPVSQAQINAMRKGIEATLEPPLLTPGTLPPPKPFAPAFVPPDPRGGRPVPPPLSRKAVSVLARKAPTEEVCNEIAQIAYDYGVGTSQQDADPGEAFDRQVIACVGKKRWPRSAAHDPALQLALDREKARLEANNKALQAELSKLHFVAANPHPKPLVIPPMPVDITQPVMPSAAKKETAEPDNR